MLFLYLGVPPAILEALEPRLEPHLDVGYPYDVTGVVYLFLYHCFLYVLLSVYDLLHLLYELVDLVIHFRLILRGMFHIFLDELYFFFLELNRDLLQLLLKFDLSVLLLLLYLGVVVLKLHLLEALYHVSMANILLGKC